MKIPSPPRHDEGRGGGGEVGGSGEGERGGDVGHQGAGGDGGPSESESASVFFPMNVEFMRGGRAGGQRAEV